MTVTADDVSVVMPVRDGERYLAEALDSVLAQSAPPGEVIVVDDGSTDGTAEVIASFGDRVRSAHQEPRGHAAALNRGIGLATRPWLAFLDADDLWTPNALAVRVARANEPGVPQLVGGRVEQFVSPELTDDERARFRFDPKPSRAQVFGAIIVRRAAFTTVGAVDESLPSASTIDWISRARVAELRVGTVDDVVLRRRLHTSNMGVVLDDDVTLRALRDAVRAHHARAHGKPDA